MTSFLSVLQPATAPTPDEVAAWLRQTGWTHSVGDDAWAVFGRSFDGQSVEVEVPQRAAAPDYPRVVEALLHDLARLERRPEAALLRDIRASAVDVVRIAMEGPATREGRLPVEAGRRVFGAARDLLLAAACSALDPRPAYATRKSERAMAVVEQARFGQSELGSFVLTMETTVALRLDVPLFADQDPNPPLERRATLQLAHAIAAAEVATRRSAASGELAPFQERTRDGLSANLCDALAEIFEASSADTVRTSFSFANRRPVVGAFPRAVLLSSDMAPTLRSAASGLREVAVLAGQEVVGSVVLLESEDATRGGAVHLRAVVDGRLMRVRVPLSAGDYAIAVEAHRTGGLVRCVGDLAREGRGRVLQNPRDFASCAEEET